MRDRGGLRFYFKPLVVAICFFGMVTGALAQSEDVELEFPDLVLHGVPFEVTVKDPAGNIVPGMGPVFRVGDQIFSISLVQGAAAVMGGAADPSPR